MIIHSTNCTSDYFNKTILENVMHVLSSFDQFYLELVPFLQIARSWANFEPNESGQYKYSSFHSCMAWKRHEVQKF